MRIADAIKMSAALPVVLQPVSYDGSLYTDGGVMCNYPIHAFDGWWNSLEPQHSIIRHLSVSELSEHHNRFEEVNSKTLGFLLYTGDGHASQNVATRCNWKNVAGADDDVPDTKLGLKSKAVKADLLKEGKERSKNIAKAVEHSKIMQRFVIQVDEHTVGGRDELRAGDIAALLDTMAVSDAIVLFRTTDPDTVFHLLDSTNTGSVSIADVKVFVEKEHFQQLSSYAELVGIKPMKVNGLGEFVSAVVNCLAYKMQLLEMKPEDEFRTVAINTGYITATSFDLEQKDKQYASRCGENAMRTFLAAHTVDKPRGQDLVVSRGAEMETTAPRECSSQGYKRRNTNPLLPLGE
jgi:arachidonate 5-lipoxygenase